MNLEIKAGNMEWSIPIERRITIIRGFSGEGKSDMVYNIANRNQMVSVDFPLECKVATETTWKDLLKSSINSLIIFDDLEEVSSNEFAKLIKEYKDNYNYYLLITRELVGLNIENELSIAVSSILRFKVDKTGLKHYTEKFYNLRKTDIRKINISHVIVEDSGNGRKFFKILFKDKIFYDKNNSGKSEIVKAVKELDKICSNNEILVLFDCAAFGCHMDDLISTTFSNIVYTDLDYECFEELLLRSNLANKLIRIDELDETRLNSELSRETVYESLLKDITAGLPFETGHDKRLNFCWKNNCNECNRNKKSKCEFYIDGDKISNLLIGTKYEKYLEL